MPKITRVTRYGDAGPKPKGTVMTVDFELDGEEFTALNGGPDEFWRKLTADGGQEIECGWLKDKYGLAWQITPTVLTEMIGDPDPRLHRGEPGALAATAGAPAPRCRGTPS